MNNDNRRIMAKHNPKILKTVSDKALYGELPEVLTIGEIASLWGENGLVNGSDDWKDVVSFLLNLIRSGKLDCVNMDVANGCIDPAKAQYEAIASAYRVPRSSVVDVYYNPINTLISRSALKSFFDQDEDWNFIEDFLIKKWFHVDDEHHENNLRINPRHNEGSANADKDKSAWRLIDDNSDMSKYLRRPTEPLSTLSTEDKDLVECRLLKHDGDNFRRGLAGWWKTQTIFKKGSGGPGKKTKPR